MPYQDKTWANGQAGGTPLNAAGLNNFETRIGTAVSNVEAGSGRRYYAAPTADDTANLQAYIVANPGARIRDGNYSITGLTIPQNNVTIQGEGRESTILTLSGTGAAISNSNPATLRRRLRIADLTIDTRSAGAGHRALELDNFLSSSVENVILNGTGASGTGVKLLGSAAKSTYFNRFINVHNTSGTACVDIGENCNANTWLGGVLEGAGKAVICNPATTQASENKFIDVAIQTEHATLMQLGAGAALCQNFEFVSCRFEPAASTLTLAANAARIMLLGGTLANTVTISDSGVETTIIVPSKPLFQTAALAASPLRTLDLRAGGAGITLGNDALTNWYRRTAGSIKTDATILEAAGTIRSFQGAANGQALNDVGHFAQGTNANIPCRLDSKGTGAIEMNTQNGATGGTKIELSGGKVGFYGTTPAVKPTVTGSRGGNAALASLLTQLAALGLVTDSSSA